MNVLLGIALIVGTLVWANEKRKSRELRSSLVLVIILVLVGLFWIWNGLGSAYINEDSKYGQYY